MPELNVKQYGKSILTEAITGYKKVKCYCLDNDTFEKKWIDKVARVTIPKGAIVIRPYTRRYDRDTNSIHFLPSKMLRSNKMTIERIYSREQIIQATSLIDSAYKYHMGETHVSDLNGDFSKTCVEGLHFFLEMNDAIHFFYV